MEQHRRLAIDDQPKTQDKTGITILHHTGQRITRILTILPPHTLLLPQIITNHQILQVIHTNMVLKSGIIGMETQLIKPTIPIILP